MQYAWVKTETQDFGQKTRRKKIPGLHRRKCENAQCLDVDNKECPLTSTCQNGQLVGQLNDNQDSTT